MNRPGSTRVRCTVTMHEFYTEEAGRIRCGRNQTVSEIDGTLAETRQAAMAGFDSVDYATVAVIRDLSQGDVLETITIQPSERWLERQRLSELLGL